MSKFDKFITATSEKKTVGSEDNAKQQKKSRKYLSYVTGPIPMAWVSDACKIGGKESKFAWACWFLYGVKNKASFSLSNVCAKRFGLSREAKRLAIKSLELAGMISVEHPPSKSPVVTIIIRKSDFSTTFKEI